MKRMPPGVVTMLQLVPSQCSVNNPWSWSPAAQMSLAETAATAIRELLPCGLGLGLGTTFQLVPFQCSITAVGRAENPPAGTPGPAPTAHTLAGDSAVISVTPPKRTCAARISAQ